MEYAKTQYKHLYIGDDGEFYTTYPKGKMVLKKSRLKKGVKVINYSDKGKKKRLNVRREVALLMVPNPENKRMVITKDGNPMNSKPDNLIWSNVTSMDYKEVAKKKIGTKYKLKPLTGAEVGDYTVKEDNGEECELRCNTCNDIKVIKRSSVRRHKGVCGNCHSYPLDISVLSSVGYFNWEVLREDETEKIRDKTKKRLVVKCNCCDQTKSISYLSYKNSILDKPCSIKRALIKDLRLKITNIKSRCLNPKNPDYVNYGGRGIEVCKEWLDNEVFIKWGLENNFELGLHIDRINNNGNYTPDNCRFVTKQENNQNQRQTILTEELVKIIKSKDWGNKNYIEIADELGFESDRSRVGKAIGTVLKGEAWNNIE